MKTKVLIVIAILIIALIVGFILTKNNTKKYSPADTATYTLNDLKVEINYCRPFKKGRIIFGTKDEGALQPYGMYWRVGANEATTFETNKDLLINGQELKAGKYQLYAYPNIEEWKIVFNTDWDKWGAREAEHETDVLETTVKPNNHAKFLEQFTITFNNPDTLGLSEIVLHWDKTQVQIPFKVK